MTKAELMEELEDLPDDAEVRYVFDGHPRTSVEHVWESQSGDIIFAGAGDVVYNDGARPEGAPTSGEERHWRTPKLDMNHSHT